MIEVTRKNRHGTVEIIAQYETEKEFGEAYWPHTIEEEFSTNPNSVNVDKKWCSWAGAGYYINNLIFKKVAYNERGKILDVGHLVGIARKDNGNYNTRRWSRNPWGFKRHKRRVKGAWMRHMKTTQERRWANAWDDEEFAPKVRSRRSTKQLPDTRDDYWRMQWKNNNWKRFRKQQWKDKK